ncbi:MAG: amidase [Betaproteobacteria bacterium]|nr:amidase [Betaproteobacteria bacterium]
MTADLFKLGVIEALDALRASRFGCADYTRALLARIYALEPQVQAFAWLDHERAMAEAEAKDREAQTGKSVGPLHGLPVAVKDIIRTRGIPTAMGSPIYDDYVPDYSARVVEKLETAGAWVLGKSVTTEFAYMTPGKTRNPWNRAHTPGGSSMGSAAAVAAGFVPAAVGTQTNGSVIRPAAFCGVVGFKPSLHLIPFAGAHIFSPTLDHMGVFTRSVADAARFAAYLSEEPGRIAPKIRMGESPPRLAAVRSPVWDRASPAQQARFLADVAALRAGGAQVTDIELPAAFGEGHRTLRTIMLFEAAWELSETQKRHRDRMSDFLNRSLDEGRAVADADYQAALEMRTRLIEELETFLKKFDAIVTPPAPGEAPADLSITGDPAFCTLWSLTGVPAITIPTGLGENGLPLGLQIVGRSGDENRVLAVAAWCEGKLPFTRP